MKTGLELLREPFPDNQIGKLPKPTKAQTDEVKDDYKSLMNAMTPYLRKPDPANITEKAT